MSWFDYVKSKEEVLTEKKSHYRMSGVDVHVRDSTPDNIDLDAAIKNVEQKVPDKLLGLIDSIHIRASEEFEERDIDAYYDKGDIFIKPNQDETKDFSKHIVHELFHLLEERFTDDIKSKKVQQEFKNKRIYLYNLLNSDGHSFKKDLFLNLKYDETFDNLLHDKIGYDNLQKYTVNLFIDPYSVTSLREYFATGFTEYFLGNQMELKKLCPKLFNKIKEIAEV